MTAHNNDPIRDRTVPLRSPHRMVADPATVHAILDEAYLCHVGHIVDGEPRVLPNLHVRIGGTVYLHTSTGGRLALAARPDGVAVCLEVCLLDGFVLGRSQMHHSVNYRSVVAHGTARLVTDERERGMVLTALVDKVANGRSADSRPPNTAELARTAVLALPLTEAAAKVRTGGPIDDPADLDLPHWAGVVPTSVVRGDPQAAPGVSVELPAYLRS